MSDYACGNCGTKNANYGGRCYECGDDWANAVEVAPSEPPKVRPREVAREGGELSCPGCKAPLERAKKLNVNASLTACYGCSRCGGVWLDNTASDLVVRRIDPGVLTFASVYELTAAPPAIETGARVCPIGQERLTTVSVKDVVLDACRAHGTWFDAGELRKVAERFEAERAELPPEVRHVLETIAGAYRSSGRRGS